MFVLFVYQFFSSPSLKHTMTVNMEIGNCQSVNSVVCWRVQLHGSLNFKTRKINHLEAVNSGIHIWRLSLTICQSHSQGIMEMPVSFFDWLYNILYCVICWSYHKYINNKQQKQNQGKRVQGNEILFIARPWLIFYFDSVG